MLKKRVEKDVNLLLHLLLCICGACAAVQEAISQTHASIAKPAVEDSALQTTKKTGLQFSGYLQPQFQVVQQKGAAGFGGGNFSEQSASRFTLRRARIKANYKLAAKQMKLPVFDLVLQIDATERGVATKDVFLQIAMPAFAQLSFTAGKMPVPYGYEVNRSSSVRETPERGRMSQILLPSERDLGIKASYAVKATNNNRHITFDLGVYNGAGASALSDFDSYKDVMGRVHVTSLLVCGSITVDAGISGLYGGWMQQSRYVYRTQNTTTGLKLVVDSVAANQGARAPRRYVGADVQLTGAAFFGNTQLRAEYWMGTQPGTATSTVSPRQLAETPTYIRNFSGGFLYLVQKIFLTGWELVAKYDWYDPNTLAAGRQIEPQNFSEPDVRFATIGIGIARHFSEQFKMMAYYDWVKNEATELPGYLIDKKDNLFTLRMQLQF